MIDLKALTRADIGREVEYRCHHTIEFGRVTSFNDHFVFVDYSGQGRGIATHPDTLSFTQTIEKE